MNKDKIIASGIVVILFYLIIVILDSRQAKADNHIVFEKTTSLDPTQHMVMA